MVRDCGSGRRRTVIAGILAGAVMFIVCRAGPIQAMPQFALMEREHCAACHISPQGGGSRNFRGWSYLRDDSLIDPAGTRAGLLPSGMPSTNMVGSRLTLGTDIRFQSAKSHISSDASRDQFTMQAALYAALELHPNIDIEGSYNIAESSFAGQEEGTASVLLHPEYSFSSLRIGYFHPAIGVRYDDHTMLVRQVPGFPGRSLIPPAYAEVGAEATLFMFDPLILTAGVFGAENLAENMVIGSDGMPVSIIDDDSKPSFAGRIEYRDTPRAGMPYLSGGTSVLVNGDFMLATVFAGVGFDDRFAVMTEYALSSCANIRTTHAASAELSMRIADWCVPYLRGEYGVTGYDYPSPGDDPRSIAALAGAQIFVLPCVALRPEYRFLETRVHRSTRYALQIHLFY